MVKAWALFGPMGFTFPLHQASHFGLGDTCIYNPSCLKLIASPTQGSH